LVERIVHPMPTRGTNRFYEREVVRIMRAAQKSGTPFDRIEVDPLSGKISVIIDKPADSEAAASPAALAWDKATEAIKAKQPERAKTAKRK
jgi:hypothetical protein